MGTEFNVKAYPDDNTIETTLVEGSIKIESIADKNTGEVMVLKPNQKLTFYKEDSRLVDETAIAKEKTENKLQSLQVQKSIVKAGLVKENIDVEPVISWKENRWIFEKQSLSRIAVELERRFDVQIYFESERLKTFRFTGTIIREVLKTIEQQSPVRFFYSDDLLVMNESIDVKADNKNIISVLDDIFSKSPLTYTAYENNLIVIVSRELLQQKQITGTATDGKTGEPLPGVNIRVDGTTIGTNTDASGRYSIDAPSAKAVLVFTFIGYTSQSSEVNGKLSIDIKLMPAEIGLDEVIVIGYGTSKRSDIVGSVSSVKASELSTITGSSVATMHQGKAAGLVINTTSA